MRQNVSIRLFLFLCLGFLAELFRPVPASALSLPWLDEVASALDRHLRSAEGLLQTRTSEKTFLSETLTLEMELALLNDERALFDTLVHRLERHFLSDANLLSWRLDEKLVQSPANASVDDLRACRTLLQAAERWQEPRYTALAERIAEALREHCVRDDLLLPGSSWSRTPVLGFLKVHSSREPVILSYADLEALRLLGRRDIRWMPVLLHMTGVIGTGAVGGAEPAWHFNPDTMAFGTPQRNLINTLLLLRSLAAEGLVPRKPVETLARELRTEGRLATDDGGENVAVYALAADLFSLSGLPEEAEKALGRLSIFRLESPDASGLLGYRQERGPAECWAFDNLLALIAATRHRQTRQSP